MIRLEGAEENYGFEIVTILTMGALLWFGAEAHGRSFVRPEPSDLRSLVG